MPRRPLSWIPFLLLLAAAAGCRSETPALEPPDGWVEEGPRRWVAGADTASLFRPLETFEAMGVARAGEASGSSAAAVLADRLQQEFLPLYRNHPRVVDSIFSRFVIPKIEGALATADFAEAREKLKREGYRLITNNFEPPRTRLQIGKEVPVIYPDSLRRQGVAGTVRMQIALDAEGEPRAIELLERVHPVLDAIALDAATQMRWRPAYLMRNGSWRPIPSWTRFSLTFGVASEADEAP